MPLCFSNLSTAPSQFSNPNLHFRASKMEVTFCKWSNSLPYLLSALSGSETVTFTPISPSAFLILVSSPSYYPLPIYFITLTLSLMVLFHTCFSLCAVHSLGPPSDPHTLWGSIGLPQMYSLCCPCCTASGGVGGMWGTGK